MVEVGGRASAVAKFTGGVTAVDVEQPKNTSEGNNNPNNRIIYDLRLEFDLVDLSPAHDLVNTGVPVPSARPGYFSLATPL